MPDDNKKSDISYLPRSWSDKCCRTPKQTNHESESPFKHEGSDHFPEPEQLTEEPLASYQDQGPETLKYEPAYLVSSCEPDETGTLELLGPDEIEDNMGPCSDEPLALDKTTLDSVHVQEPIVVPQEQGSICSKTRITGIRFGYACKVYHFDAGDIDLEYGEWVVVKTEKGLGLGQVAIPPYEREIDATQAETLRKIIRKGGKVDVDQKERCCQRESEAYVYCLDKIEELALPMKLVSVECFFDCSKYVFYFTSEGRVDFRELVKQLVSRFPVRIEMRQIGVRHEAKMTGGIACCGQELCCSRFLTDFRPVSVKMAKNQNLSLNPTKISGVCGRLMCCLSYEHDIYEDFSKSLPRVGKLVSTTKGEGCVIKHNPLEETVLVKLADDTTIEIRPEEILGELELDTAKKNVATGRPTSKTSRKAHGKKQQNDSPSNEN